MVAVRTLLRLPNGKFKQVEQVEERPDDPRHVEGAIELIVDGVRILSIAEWDYVDQLWAYISDMVNSLPKDGEVSTCFPDQPIVLTFLRGNLGRLFVSCQIGEEVRRVNVDEGNFMTAIRTAGEAFFREMSELLPENAVGYALALRSLK